MYCCHKFKKKKKKPIWAKKKFENQRQVKTQFFHHNIICSRLSECCDRDCVPRTSSRSAWNPEDATWARGKANKGLNTRSQLRKHTAWRARWCSLGWVACSGVGGWRVQTQGVAHVGMNVNESRLNWLRLKRNGAAEIMRVEQNLGLVCEWRLQAVSPV